MDRLDQTECAFNEFIDDLDPRQAWRIDREKLTVWSALRKLVQFWREPERA